LAVDAEHHLYLLSRPWHCVWIGTPPPPARVALLDNVEHVEIAYWDSASETWVSRWVTLAIPKLLRIRIVPGAGAAWRWPAIIAVTERDPWIN
jgi:hypothetical protein